MNNGVSMRVKQETVFAGFYNAYEIALNSENYVAIGVCHSEIICYTPLLYDYQINRMWTCNMQGTI